jgi:hypothetical protein
LTLAASFVRIEEFNIVVSEISLSFAYLPGEKRSKNREKKLSVGELNPRLERVDDKLRCYHYTNSLYTLAVVKVGI